jgi:hypothetical protein
MVFFAMRTTEEITPTLTRKQIHVDEIYMYVHVCTCLHVSL